MEKPLSKNNSKHNPNSEYRIAKFYKFHKYPVFLPEEVFKKLSEKCKNKHSWKKIRYVLQMLFFEMTELIDSCNYDLNFFFDDFFTIKSTVSSKVCKISETPVYKPFCKRVRVSFEGKLKRRLQYKLNEDNEKVIKFLNTKKWNRRMIRRYIIGRKIEFKKLQSGE